MSKLGFERSQAAGDMEIGELNVEELRFRAARRVV
jgi:hypothetical protein